MTKNQALFATNLQVHGKITSKDYTAMHLLKKTKGLNKQGSYKGPQTTNYYGNEFFFGRLFTANARLIFICCM